MAVFIVCRCGQRLRAADEMRGRRVSCPKCGATPRVPVSDDAPLAETLFDGPSPGDPLLDALKDVVGGTTCPACGAQGKPGAVACHACGSSLETGHRVSDSDPGVSLRKRRRSWAPAWLIAVWELVPHSLGKVTPRGVPLTVSGSGFLVLGLIIGAIVLLIMSNTEEARIGYLRTSLVRQLESELSSQSPTPLRSELIRALRFHELETEPLIDPGHASRRFRGALALGTDDRVTVIAHVRGEFDPGTLFVGHPIFPGRVQARFDIAEGALERLVTRRGEDNIRRRR